MRYLLDTNACIRYINGRAPNLRVVFHSKALSDIVVSSVTKAEMYFGSQKSQTPERTRAEQEAFLRNMDSLHFDDNAAEEYSRIRAYLEKRGTPISTRDMLIAAIARQWIGRSYSITQRNSAEFQDLMSKIGRLSKSVPNEAPCNLKPSSH